ncbi:MAG: hypothetical protein RBU25_10500 [Lentisphaeria bacterium]|jgi:hypothetical protein|nr:hypothetical protein [Lentisphaeria bacterium]
MQSSRDLTVVRDLAKRYAEEAARPVQNQRRDLWRQHNSLVRTRPLIYVRAFAWSELPESRCLCEDPFLRGLESQLRQKLFWASLEDDSVFEPWFLMNAVKPTPGEGAWGLPIRWVGRGHDTAGICESPLRDPEDLARMVVPEHRVDEPATQARYDRIQETFGDVLPVSVDTSPLWVSWNGDISTCISQLRGLEQIMWDMMDRPEWLHQLLAFMRDGILKAHREAETAGDWRLNAHGNQAIPYAKELRDPAADSEPIQRRDLWCFCAAQEFTGIGPAQFDEFLFQYQLPILHKFGLVAYGCCEDLTRKIDVLRQLPNLRRIAVSPMADVAACAEQIGDDYVFSYRPSPSDMVGYSWDEARVRRILRRDLGICQANGCHVDITLKDVETVQGEGQRLRDWMRVTREVIAELYGE